MCISAEGAGYKSQGQVRSEAEHVAPGNETKNGVPALKGRNMVRISAFQASNRFLGALTRGDALRACPWLLYFAPSALLDQVCNPPLRRCWTRCSDHRDSPRDKPVPSHLFAIANNILRCPENGMRP